MDGSSRPAPDGYLRRYKLDPVTLPFYVLGLANITILFGIAAGNIFLGLGLGVLLFTRWFGAGFHEAPAAPPPGRFRLEAPAIPTALLGLYVLWTLVSLAFMPSPELGLPQVKKFFILLVLPAAYTAFRRGPDPGRVLKWTFVSSAIAGLLALVEFGIFYRALAAAKDFYSAYSEARIIGFMGHWQTFSGQQMLVLTMLLAALLYSRKRPWWLWTCAAVIALSLLFSMTRGAWLGFVAAALYLLWPFGRRWIVAVPLAILLFSLAAPPFFRERILSFTNLRSDSSNQARVLMMRTGVRMIAAHPLVGVGPNRVLYDFDAYRPPGPIPRAWYGHLHNNYVHIAAERGLPALALFLAFLLVVLRDQRRLAARLPAGRRYVAHGVAAALVAILVSGAFQYNFGDSPVAMLLLFFIAHGYAAAREDAAAADTAGAAAPAAYRDNSMRTSPRDSQAVWNP